eukprot:scaffold42310_cov19-Tisochrysis_lutea.AAC.1
MNLELKGSPLVHIRILSEKFGMGDGSEWSGFFGIPPPEFCLTCYATLSYQSESAPRARGYGPVGLWRRAVGGLASQLWAPGRA